MCCNQVNSVSATLPPHHMFLRYVTLVMSGNVCGSNMLTNQPQYNTYIKIFVDLHGMPNVSDSRGDNQTEMCFLQALKSPMTPNINSGRVKQPKENLQASICL